ncbi:DUF4034 domain-containing protein [Deinococcus sp. KNUC1210]|uniref:DUF4034 domain-containing protein n=1 Tax=Deinococcus sp. KNUC1210 TaxID=2917691 RepID=UPI001EF0DBD5|nr:DUF4034 domain-containing protein [Deinococcus sp. KNUC1210]ULH15765.1 DUF4034 domain-containing protein [Deinococcus sp. KNUC1210]
MLRTRQFSALDGQLQAVQQQFEGGDLGERDLIDAFRVFDRPDPALGEHFNAWLEELPASYVAHVALSTWLLARAWAFRGGTTSDLVSDRGRRGLAYYLAQADSCARHAVSLSRNPLAAWNVVAGVARTQGNPLSLHDVEAGAWPDWYVLALEQNPDSLILRRSMLQLLRTEWGGSDSMMLIFLRSLDGKLSSSDRQRLWAQYHSQVSHHALHFAEHEGQALEHARMAADLHPSESAQLLKVLMSVRPALSGGRDVQQAAYEQVLTHLELHPQDRLYHADWAMYRFLDAGNEAFLPRTQRLLDTLARRGDSDAVRLLGRLAIKHKRSGLLRLDVWALLEQATDEGDALAALLLVEYHRAAPADREAADEALLQGANLGQEHCAWQVYQGWSRFEGTRELGDRDRLRFLLVAADNGQNDARVELAALLRAGRAELGADGVLRPIAGKPIQESLDYAKHLLERAAHEGQTEARALLKEARERDWDAGTARVRGRPRAAVWRRLTLTLNSSARPWRLIWVVGFLTITGFRACTQGSSSAPQLDSSSFRQLEPVSPPVTALPGQK